MKFIPFTSVGEFTFDKSIEETKKIINEEFVVGVREELYKKYPSLYIPVRKIFIVFNENGSFIRTIEIENNIFFQDINLFRISFIKIKEFMDKNSIEYIEDMNIIEIEKYGIIMTKGIDYINKITFYSKEYSKEEEISPDDIIKYYLR